MAMVQVGEIVPWKGAWWLVSKVDAEKGEVTLEIKAETAHEVKRKKAKKRD